MLTVSDRQKYPLKQSEAIQMLTRYIVQYQITVCCDGQSVSHEIAECAVFPSPLSAKA
jgi:hypothetical protein